MPRLRALKCRSIGENGSDTANALTARISWFGGLCLTPGANFHLMTTQVTHTGKATIPANLVEIDLTKRLVYLIAGIRAHQCG